ncbi:hypothetical protein Trydic_g16571 [Trypoxylus dichotomus]
MLRVSIILFVLLVLTAATVIDTQCGNDLIFLEHPNDCTKYFICWNNSMQEFHCPPGLSYNHDLHVCDIMYQKCR